MHIDPTTHEHPTSATVYIYEADYDVGSSAISWRAVVRSAEGPEQPLHGSVPLTSPAVATLAEQAVRDAIVKRIDAFDDAMRGA